MVEFKPEGFEKEPKIGKVEEVTETTEKKEGGIEKKETTIELDEKTIKDISSTPRGNEFIRKIKRAVAFGSLVLLSTGVFAQEKPQQDKIGQDIENVDMKALKKELVKIIGKEHKDAVISKIFNIHGEENPAYLIQEEGGYKLVVPGTADAGRHDIAKLKAKTNIARLLGAGGFMEESSSLTANKKDGTITWFSTISVDDVTADKLLK